MLMQFKSPATETITMFDNDAVQLLKLMGATGRVPGGLTGEDVQAAMARLESAVEEMKAQTNADTAVRPADCGRRHPVPIASSAVVGAARALLRS